jgi:ubiquinone/menaquinone biosynthesis C-methylase UbiE
VLQDPARGDASHAVFDRVAGEYARTRPDYPAAALDRLVHATGLTHGSDVLDLAAGTGKLTAALVARGLRVVAVEPLPRMRRQLERQLPHVVALDGTAEQIPLEDASFDVVCVAQAFHWFEPRAAVAEVARVLRPGGWLALLWNLWDLDDPMQAELDRIVEPLATGRIRPLTTGNHPHGAWPAALAASDAFASAERARFPHEVELDAVSAGERVASISQVQAAPAPERAAVIARARSLVASLPGGRSSFRYQTELELWHRR